MQKARVPMTINTMQPAKNYKNANFQKSKNARQTANKTGKKSQPYNLTLDHNDDGDHDDNDDQTTMMRR